MKATKNRAGNVSPQAEVSRRRRRAMALAAGLSWVMVCGCGTARTSAPLSPVEQASQERSRGERWARRIEQWMPVREEARLERDLTAISSRLGSSDRPRIRFFGGAAGGPTAPVFVLPGGHWYFSVHALQGLRYDNELAAAVAAAQALGEREFAGAAGVTPSGPGAVDPGAFWMPECTPADWKRVSARMVEILYRAGYDPRGVPQFWRKSAPAWTGMPPDWTLQLQEGALAEIARRAPLLNPVVRTPEFGEIEKRLKQL